MPNLPLDPTVLMLAIAAIVAILLYFHEANLRKKLESASDEFLQDLREKGWDTLHQSIKKSQDILGEAELEGIKVVAGSKIETAKFEQDIQKKIVEAQAEFLRFLQDLQKRSEEFEEAEKKAGQTRINQLFDSIEAKLSDFLIQTAQKTTSAIELELKASRQLIDTYKSEQLKLIDENIIAMMEQTLSIVLAKKLSLKDQLDLVYEALEKAKIEKFIV